MEPQPQKTEGEYLAELRQAGRDAALKWSAYIGATERAQLLLQEAQAAGVPGAERMLPACCDFPNSQSPKLLASLREVVAREFATKDEAQAAFDGAN
ncbi:hypothetical protein GobsT_12630 [Gemmata obscuriglobus]|uniref:Uncharacterized protein n=1 Tax=Gemmata obscuriglobus TaxID=114 RepID=A0A2Z3H9R9_9BACT|nr:hypothetical protein [Gemmata obscuriglobus]AWM40277.1 hypothetical protein C1280_26920 [Gemmata obscuriglobus]QEG26523.1 hypothetical protein GobsT_12630 [Gemmata obscuriglobus]VTS01856.1 unnamed protein product [Gemmata obscuriglobus UQM 2246]